MPEATYLTLENSLALFTQKTSPHGDKRMKESDWKLVKQIKEQVQNLPDLDIAPEDCHIILETDGCMEGWGGVCKWKPKKKDPRSMEKVCAYASGKFPVLKSTIDAEIHACMETVESLKIHYLDKKEITLRTGCQAIISFYNKTSNNKPSRVRWIGFTDYITGSGVKIEFEHIDGKNNVLADYLSRLTMFICADNTEECRMNQVTKQNLIILEEAIQEVQDTNGTRYSQTHLEELQQTIQALFRMQLSRPIEKTSYKFLEGQPQLKERTIRKSRQQKKNKGQLNRPLKPWPNGTKF